MELPATPKIVLIGRPGLLRTGSPFLASLWTPGVSLPAPSLPPAFLAQALSLWVCGSHGLVGSFSELMDSQRTVV